MAVSGTDPEAGSAHTSPPIRTGDDTPHPKHGLPAAIGARELDMVTRCLCKWAQNLPGFHPNRSYQSRQTVSNSVKQRCPLVSTLIPFVNDAGPSLTALACHAATTPIPSPAEGGDAMARTYRTSSLPLLLTCPAAQIEPAVRVVQSSPQARDGTAAHELLRGLPETGQVAWGALEAVCERHQADPAEVRLLVGNGVAMWGDLAPMFAGGVAESELRLERGDLVLTGHTDLVAFRTEEGGLARSDGTVSWTRQLARILDWKGGRLDADYRWQMQGYCALVLHNFPELDEATATVIWLREREFENYTMDREAMPRWVQLVSDSLQWDGRSYVPGSHCQYCPRSHECPARLALVHEAATVVRSSDRPNLSTMTADNMIALYDQAGEVERLAKRVREAIRTRVLWQGDVEGSTHALRSRKERRRVLDPREAWPVLEGRGFSEDDFAQCLTMHAPEVERIIRERAPHRKKTQAVRELREALIEKGALTEVEFRKVSKRRV